jgi:putative ATPase
MKKLGYGRDYEYAHNDDDAVVGQRYLPEELQNARYWQGVARGQEAELVERLERLNAEKAKRRAKPTP